MEWSKVVLGLGNPGARYSRTRHNIGFRVLDLLAERHEVPFVAETGTDGVVETAKVLMDHGPVVLAKPRTYMNRSGLAGIELCRRFNVEPEQFLVVYDEADLPLGRLRLRRAGSAGGHNGIRSLLEAFPTGEFSRLRLGVHGEGRQEGPLADYVLAPFEPEEEPLVDGVCRRAVDAIECVLRKGIQEAMNRYNARLDEADGDLGPETQT